MPTKVQRPKLGPAEPTRPKEEVQERDLNSAKNLTSQFGGSVCVQSHSRREDISALAVGNSIGVVNGRDCEDGGDGDVGRSTSWLWNT